MLIIWNFGSSDEATTVKIYFDEYLMRKVIEFLLQTLGNVHVFLGTGVAFEDGALNVDPTTCFPFTLISPDCLHLGLVKTVLRPVGDWISGLCNGFELLLLRSFIVRIPHYILNVQNNALTLISPINAVKAVFLSHNAPSSLVFIKLTPVMTITIII